MTTRLPLAAIVVTSLLSALLLPGTSEALTARAQAENELERLSNEISRLDEQFNVARLQLSRAEAAIRDAKARKATAEAHLGALREMSSARAAALYKEGLAELFLAILLSDDPQGMNRRVEIASKVGDWEAGLMESIEIGRARSEQIDEELTRNLSAAKDVRDRIASRKRAIETLIARQKSLLSRLESPGPQASVSPPPAVSGRAGVAVQTAYQQLGKPYRYGASGPDAFDCSGLTMYSWGRAGVALPHSSRAQYAATPRVGRDQLQPGDLVFFGSPIHHVGMYVGGGMMIHAPESGERVRLYSINRRDYVGAGRPGG